MSTIKTKFGDVQVSDITKDLFDALQKGLTYGFVHFDKPFNGSGYGFVVRCGESEIPCLKQQPVDMEKDTAMQVLNMHASLIADTLSQMAKDNINCIYYATPYLKDKGNGTFESGIAHFIFPGEGADSEDNFGPDGSFAPYDGALGEGATTLFMKFMKIYNAHFNDKFRIPYIGIDIRTRSELGAIVSGFMLCNGKIIFHGTQADERDSRFGILARHGITTVYHSPSAPMAISEEQLAEAKGIK